MKSVIDALHRFFFARISASGFGLMRIAWAATVLSFFLMRFQDVALLYSEAGIVPENLYRYSFRTEYRFTILDAIQDPSAVYLIYWIFMGSLVCSMLGLWTRWSTSAAVLLLFSFHERNLLPLGGGDTTLRLIGCMLLISPEVRAFSLDRAKQQWTHWKKTGGKLLAPLQMSAWPYRLALWQVMCIYLSAGWDKLQGSMWQNGTAVASALHHQDFNRLPLWFMDQFSVFSPVISKAALLFFFAWGILLIPRPVFQRITLNMLPPGTMKRTVLMMGTLFHGSIFIFMQVGSFPQAMLTYYLGLLQKDDFDWARRGCNFRWKGKISVLYDGQCILCRRSVFVLQLLDRLGRLDPIDFHDAKKRKTVAPDLKMADLDKAMHIVLPRKQAFKGFRAFRTLCWHLPALWIAVPVLYIPGMSILGDAVYARIADSRVRCTGDTCSHK